MLFNSLRWEMVLHFAFSQFHCFAIRMYRFYQLIWNISETNNGWQFIHCSLCMVGRNGTKFFIWWIETRKSNERWKNSVHHIYAFNAKQTDDGWWLVSENCGWYNKNEERQKKIYSETEKWVVEEDEPSQFPHNFPTSW